MGRKNIKIPEPLFNALRDDKDDNQSWPHYLESECLGAGDGVGEVGEQLDRIEAAAKEATNAAQNAERAAEELQR